MHLGFLLWILVVTDLQLNVCTCMSVLKLLNTSIACLYEYHHALGTVFCRNSGHSRWNNFQYICCWQQHLSHIATNRGLWTLHTTLFIQISWLSASHSCNMSYLLTWLECCCIIYGMEESSSYMQCVQCTVHDTMQQNMPIISTIYTYRSVAHKNVNSIMLRSILCLSTS
jgi:hypothetical protein